VAMCSSASERLWEKGVTGVSWLFGNSGRMKFVITFLKIYSCLVAELLDRPSLLPEVSCRLDMLVVKNNDLSCKDI
jgi:hypothetical protein